jgi:hypothetical protein
VVVGGETPREDARPSPAVRTSWVGSSAEAREEARARAAEEVYASEGVREWEGV